MVSKGGKEKSTETPKKGGTNGSSSKTKRRLIEENSELLGLLTILISERTGITLKEIANAISPGVTNGEAKNDAKNSDSELTRLREKGTPLEPQKEKRLKAFLNERLKALAAEDKDHILLRDLSYLYGFAFNEVGINYPEHSGLDDERSFDRELIERLRIKGYDPKTALNSAHGLWYVFRHSTLSDGDHINVSVLSVKDLDYVPLRHSGMAVRRLSHIPHFSLRTPRNPQDNDNSVKPHIFRGWVVHTLHPTPVLNFFGSRREDYAPLFMMTLKMNTLSKHATEGRGVAIMSNKYSLFSGPVAACYVTRSDAIHKLRNDPLSDDERDRQLSEGFRLLRDHMMRHVGRHDPQFVLKNVADDCAPQAVASALEWLCESKRNAAEPRNSGMHFVPSD